VQWEVKQYSGLVSISSPQLPRVKLRLSTTPDFDFVRVDHYIMTHMTT
jgi:hypothetical protein